MLGKKLSEKSAKKFFYIHTNFVTKYGGGKTRETIFQKHKISGIKKCREKNRRKKVRKSFLYSHKYRYKIWGKNARNNF